MNPAHDWDFEPGQSQHVDPRLCEFHTSDGWLVVDALISILTGVATIVLVALRHLLRIAVVVVAIAMIGTVAGWWVP